jgi:SpoIID/LytB domain protein
VLLFARMRVITRSYHRPTVRPRRWPRGAVLLAATLAILSVCATPAAAASTLVVEGAGDGHGVGMSQDGALGYAQHGASYRAILAHYYTGTTLGQAPANAVVRVLVGAKVQRLPLERYVRGVVAAEMPSSWPLAALEAQAIASRTYALTAHAGGSRFDVYSDTRSQVYAGVAAETATTNSAIAATAGQIVLYGGRPATTYFFASSGGVTENIENSFLGAQPEPWLRGVADAYEGRSSNWRLSMSFSAVSAHLQGLLRGSFRGIEVLKRGVSPRILAAVVLGSGGSTPVSGPELAARLGLTSTWAYFSVKSATGLTREPDRSGQTPGSVAPAPPTAPAPLPAGPPAMSSQGGVAPAAPPEATATASAVSAGGGTSAPG